MRILLIFGHNNKNNCTKDWHNCYYIPIRVCLAYTKCDIAVRSNFFTYKYILKFNFVVLGQMNTIYAANASKKPAVHFSFFLYVCLF